MNWAIYHIASGHVFFSGVVLLIIAALISTQPRSIAKHFTPRGIMLGAIAILISSTAIPYWYYGIAIVVTIVWIVAYRTQKWSKWAAFAFITTWAIGAAIEIPYHVLPHLEPASSRSITVIGDSITAGLGEKDKTVRWPTLLAEKHNLTVQDFSYMGDTVASALERVETKKIITPVVILEIGGNDMLGYTSSAQFSKGLDALLEYVCAPGRQVLMFELPLPPFMHEYGRIQRSLALKYNVLLIPKRILLSILTTNGATVDSVHLTEAGQAQMAASTWQLMSSAFPE